MIKLGVAAVSLDQATRASALARKLVLPLLEVAVSAPTVGHVDAILYAGPNGLFLQQTGKGAPGPVSAQFGGAAMRHRRRAGQNEMLGRAVGVGKKPRLRVLDATAGLGRDSFILADLGCEVILREHHPVVIELLMSGLNQARVSDDSWLQQIVTNMDFHPGDAREPGLPPQQATDVIYLDPMFPGRSKSASVKKEMALFQALLERADSTSDADGLLLWSLDQDVARVVVKRPARASELAGRKPSHVIAGKSVRYDVYVLGAIV